MNNFVINGQGADPQKVEVLVFAVDTGQLLLENGAEVERVEDTMHRICHAFGVESLNCFMLSNGIFVSAGSKEDPYIAECRHVPVNKSRLDLVCAVNQMSREISEGRYTIEEAREVLKRIRMMPGKKVWTRTVAGGMTAFGFCYMFGQYLPDCCLAFLGGCLLQAMMILCFERYLTSASANILGGALTAVTALLFGHLPFTHSELNIIIGMIMLLTPGVAFVNGIRDFTTGDYLSGSVRLLDAILRFICLAVGIGAVFLADQYLLGGVLL